MVRLYFIIVIFLVGFGESFSQDVQFSAFADWRIKISTRDVLFAGDDLPVSYVTSPAHARLTVQLGADTHNNRMKNKWSVQIQARQRDWDRRLKLYVKRTGDGHGSRFDKALKGGMTNQMVSSSPRTLFSCFGWRKEIPLQFELSGVSVVLPAKTYAMELIFTIVDE